MRPRPISQELTVPPSFWSGFGLVLPAVHVKTSKRTRLVVCFSIQWWRPRPPRLHRCNLWLGFCESSVLIHYATTTTLGWMRDCSEATPLITALLSPSPRLKPGHGRGVRVGSICFHRSHKCTTVPSLAEWPGRIAARATPGSTPVSLFSLAAVFSDRIAPGGDWPNEA